MTQPIRLSKYLAAMVPCSRGDAERYISGGWVSVDGRVVENPAHPVSGEVVTLDAAARLDAVEPATFLLHKPAGFDAIDGPKPAAELVHAATRWPEDPSGVRLLQRHFHNLTPLVPLDTEASGLMVLTQDGRVWRRLTEDGDAIEQEFVVEVSGDIAPDGLRRLNHGLHYGGRALAPCKVSWQNEVRLRFAIKGAQGGQLRDMCAQVGLDVVAIRRIRIGRIALAMMPVGTWRCLPVGERF
jgi:23S rRNA pseudouridine2604 synthase